LLYRCKNNMCIIYGVFKVVDGENCDFFVIEVACAALERKLWDTG